MACPECHGDRLDVLGTVEATGESIHSDPYGPLKMEAFVCLNCGVLFAVAAQPDDEEDV